MSTIATPKPKRVRPSRARSRRKLTTASAPLIPATTAARESTLNSNQLDYVALNRLSSAYLAGHRAATLGDTSVLDLIAWAQDHCGMRAKTMTAR